MHTIGQGLIYHHTAVLVKSMQDALNSYTLVFGDEAVSKVYSIQSQQVSVCFINTGNGAFIELVEPFAGSNAFDAYFKRGINYYHIAYTTNTFDDTMQQLDGAGYRTLSTFFSEAFSNKRCAFLLSSLGYLIEIIEA